MKELDIPKQLNYIVWMLRGGSSIIFIQQLGRGTKKDPSKEFG